MVPQVNVNVSNDLIQALSAKDPASQNANLGALIAAALGVGQPFDINVQLTSAAAATPVILIPDSYLLPTQKVYVSEIMVQVSGGTLWATVANVFLQDTAATITHATIPVAGLTANAVLIMGAAGITLGAAILAGTGGTAGKGLQVAGNANGTGSTLNVRIIGQIR